MSQNYVVTDGEVSSGLAISGYSDSILVSGGTATDSLVTGGTMTVTRGGHAEDTMLTGDGRMYVTINGTANNTVLGGDSGNYNSMSMVVSSANAGHTTINSGGTLMMSRGAEMHDTVVNSGGKVFIYGGTAFSTVVNSSGVVNNNSGTIYGATVATGGRIDNVGENAVASGVTIEGGANMGISGGARANNTVLEGSSAYVHLSGGTACNTVIGSGGSMTQAGGIVDSVTVNMGGTLSAGFRWYGAIPETDSAANVIENGGQVIVETSSYYDYDTSSYKTKLFPVVFASNTFSGLTYSNYSGTVHSGTTAVDITATGGGLTVYSGGILNGFKASGSETVDEYGYRYFQCGTLEVLAGGTATGIVADLPDSNDYYNSYLAFQIAPGTVVSATVNGDEFHTNIGVVENTTATKVGLELLSGATVTNLTQIQGRTSVYVGAIVNGLTLSGTALNIESGAAVDGVTGTGVPVKDTVLVNPWGGGEDDPLQYVEVDVMRGAYVYVDSGATVTNLNLDADSPLTVHITSQTVVSGISGGVAYDIKDGYFGNNKLDNTTLYLHEGKVENLVVNNGGVVSVDYGQTALEMTENGGAVYVETDDPDTQYSFISNTFSGMALRGEVTVHKNTIASNNTLVGGMLTVYSGGIVRDFYAVNGDMNITDVNLLTGAIATNVDMTRYFTEGHGGHAEIQYGATVSGLRLKSDDFVYLYLDSSTVIENAAVDGKPFSFDGSVLSGYRINEGMNSDLYIGEGVTAIVDVWVTNSPIYTDGGLHGVNVTLDRSYMRLNRGDYFENLTVATGTYRGTYTYNGSSYVQYDYGSATVSSGAVVDGVTVNNGGTLIVSSGGKITGVMRFGSASTTVSCGSGAIVDFDLTDKSALYVARSNDWRFNGKNKDVPRYTITVDAQQGAGTYVLANSTYFSDTKYFYLLDANGNQYGYFDGYFYYEKQADETYAYKFASSYSGDTIEGLTLTLDAIQIDRDDGVIDFDLVLKVESNYAAPKWVAAPTVTVGNETFTCQDVILTASYGETVTLKEYSLDGTAWQAFEGMLTASANGTYFFRGTDAEGTVSDVVSCTVSNIDKVAPTTASDFAVTADDADVILSWEDATDDFSGVAGFNLLYWKDGSEAVSVATPAVNYAIRDITDGTWHWTVQTYDYAGNVSSVVSGLDFVVSGGTVTPIPAPTPTRVAKGDVDGNGISDVLFQYTGGDYQLGYWMNGTNEWRGQGLRKPAEWEVLGSYDMNNNGMADAVLVGNVEVNGVKGAYIGYYLDSVDTDANWQNIGYLNNADGIAWKNKVGNLTGTAGANSIVWYAPELYALGAWTDGTDSWVTLSSSFGGDAWTLVGCGDFNGDGKDSVLMSYNNGQLFYAAGIDGAATSLGSANWSGWDVRAIGDFAGDGKDDLVLFHKASGSMVMLADGNADSYTSVGQLDANDWFVVGAGNYNGDQKDDLLVRQYSTGMLGYYSSGNTANWVELGRGVDMNWTVIA